MGLSSILNLAGAGTRIVSPPGRGRTDLFLFFRFLKDPTRTRRAVGWYETIQTELYLRDWKASVRGKLDNLQNIVETIKDNFSMSWENLLDQLQMYIWLILLIGYVYLYFLDAGWVTIP